MAPRNSAGESVDGLHPLNTVAEAAAYLRVSVRTIRRYIEAGHLPVRRLPTGKIRLRREDILELASEPPPAPLPAVHRVRRDPSRVRPERTNRSVAATLSALETWAAR